jgi:hypothetical protein
VGWVMDKRILDLIGDFRAWGGNTYKLANMICELQKEINREKLIEAGHTEAAEVV